jgi:hypothetical protein
LYKLKLGEIVTTIPTIGTFRSGPVCDSAAVCACRSGGAGCGGCGGGLGP